MRIKITFPINNYQAGLIYEVPYDEAVDLIKSDMAIEIKEEQEEKPKPKRKAHNNEVKNGDG
jgi:hypothetical protein